MGLSARMPGWPGRCPLHAWCMRSSRLLVSRDVLGAPRLGTSRHGPSMRTGCRRRAPMVPPHARDPGVRNAWAADGPARLTAGRPDSIRVPNGVQPPGVEVRSALPSAPQRLAGVVKV
eukprot:4226703-Pyramimonas_sp.AAC.1